VVDGREQKVDGPDEGFWLGPSLFDHVRPDMSVYTDEIFGPVLSVLRVDTYDQALRLVNGNPYGNGTAIFTNDGGAARRYQNEVEVGMVGINVPIPVPMAYYSFGGWKHSLFGDSHAHGTEGVHFFTRGKVVTSRWVDPAKRSPGTGSAASGVDLGFPTSR
jgi:malonate-semialdehyde dehydrogenase (acetylating)/methylmalonate-semialdehyde dehydrogenase